MESESEGSEGFLFLPTPLLLQSLTILCKLEAQVEESADHRAHSQSLMSTGLLEKHGGLLDGGRKVG